MRLDQTDGQEHVEKVVEQTKAIDFFIEKPLLIIWQMIAILAQMTPTAAHNSCSIISFIEICFWNIDLYVEIKINIRDEE